MNKTSNGEDANQHYAHGATLVATKRSWGNKFFMCDSNQHKSRGATLDSNTLMGRL